MQRQIQQDLLPLIGPGYKDVEQNLHFLNKTAFEPSREILVLFVLRKHSANAHAQPSSGARCVILVWPFVYFHTSCVRTAKALARLRGCTGSPEPSLVPYAISTIIAWAGSFILWKGFSALFENEILTNCDVFKVFQILYLWALLHSVWHMGSLKCWEEKGIRKINEMLRFCVKVTFVQCVQLILI